jgi:hypothetical protein
VPTAGIPTIRFRSVKEPLPRNLVFPRAFPLPLPPQRLERAILCVHSIVIGWLSFFPPYDLKLKLPIFYFFPLLPLPMQSKFSVEVKKSSRTHYTAATK